MTIINGINIEERKITREEYLKRREMQSNVLLQGNLERVFTPSEYKDAISEYLQEHNFENIKTLSTEERRYLLNLKSLRDCIHIINDDNRKSYIENEVEYFVEGEDIFYIENIHDILHHKLLDFAD